MHICIQCSGRTDSISLRGLCRQCEGEVPSIWRLTTGHTGLSGLAQLTGDVDENDDDNDDEGDEETGRNESLYRDINLKTDEFQSEENGKIIKSPRRFGVELEMVAKKSDNLRNLSASLARSVGVAHDGSIGGGHGIEIQTPILKGELGEVCLDYILSKAKKYGFSVNSTCGTHCHLEASDFIPKDKYTIEWVDVGLTMNTENMIGVLYRNVLPEMTDDLKKLGLFVFPLSVSDDDEFFSIINMNDKELLKTTIPNLKQSLEGNEEIFITYIPTDLRGKIEFKSIIKVIKSKNALTTFIRKQDTNRHILEKIKNLMAFYLVFDDVFLSMMNAKRRVNRFAKPLKDRYSLYDIIITNKNEDFDTLWYKHRGERGTNGGRDQSNIRDRKSDRHDSSRYVGINFHSLLGKNGTLEIRYHSGTLNKELILMWVSLHQRIMDMVASGSITMGAVEEANRKIRFENKLKDFFTLLQLDEKHALHKYVQNRIKSNN